MHPGQVWVLYGTESVVLTKVTKGWLVLDFVSGFMWVSRTINDTRFQSAWLRTA